MTTFGALVTTHNSEQTIVQCLRSLKGFDEILVVDDCSNDATREIVKACGVDCYRMKRWGGVTKAKNAGVQLLDTDFIAICDSDDYRLTPPAIAPSLPYADLYCFPCSTDVGPMAAWGEAKEILIRSHLVTGGLLWRRESLLKAIAAGTGSPWVERCWEQQVLYWAVVAGCGKVHHCGGEAVAHYRSNWHPDQLSKHSDRERVKLIRMAWDLCTPAEQDRWSRLYIAILNSYGISP